MAVGGGACGEGSTSMNWVDYVLLVIVALSGIHGLRLGAAMQVLTFGGLLLGLFLGALLAPSVARLVHGATSKTHRRPDRADRRGHHRGRPGPPARGALGPAPAAAASRARRLGLRCGRGRGGGAHRDVGGGDPRCRTASTPASTGRCSSRASCAPSTTCCPPSRRCSPAWSGSWPRTASPSSSPACPRRPPAPVNLPDRRVGTRRGAARRRIDGPDRGGGVRRHPGGIGLRGGPRARRHQRPRRGRDPRRPTSSTPAAATPPSVALFDPKLDIAVLRVHGLSDPVLPVDAAVVARGTTGVVLGYPEGGPLTARKAGVAAAFEAVGLDIYGELADDARDLPARRRGPARQLGWSPGGVGRPRHRQRHGHRRRLRPLDVEHRCRLRAGHARRAAPTWPGPRPGARRWAPAAASRRSAAGPAPRRRGPGGKNDARGAADRGLRAHRRHPHRGPGRPQRVDRLAVPAPLRLRRLLRPAPRRRRARVLAHRPRHRRLRGAAPLPRRHASCSRRSSRPPTGVAKVVDCMPIREDHPQVVRMVEAVQGRGRHAHGPRHPLRLRVDGALGAPGRRPVVRHRRSRRPVAVDARSTPTART